MPHFFLILFKINLVLLLFAAAYHLVLRKLTFYTINRVFLLFGILFSTAYPSINLTEFFGNNEVLPAFVPGLNQNVEALAKVDFFDLMWHSLTFVFYVGMLFMAFRLLIQFISLSRVHKNSKPGLIGSQKVRILSDEVSPFSFWQTIYVNPILHKKEDLNNIIEHEKVHVKELHTIDIILTEISLVFYWFNPGIWLMKKTVRENIEFITDAKILNKGIDKKAYQYSLLDVGTLRPSVAIVNNFNLSDLKKRIKMMNAKRSSKVNLTRYMFVLPVLLCITLAFTIDKKAVQTKILPIEKIFIEILPKIDVKEKRNRKVLNKRKSAGQPKIETKQQELNINKDTIALDVVYKSMEDLALVKDKEGSKKSFITKFFFNTGDTIHTENKPDVKNIIIRIKKSEDENRAAEPLKAVNFIHLTSMANASKDSLGALKKVYTYTNTTTMDVGAKRTKTFTYILNGNEISQKEISKIMPDEILSITLNKEGIMNLKTKNK